MKQITTILLCGLLISSCMVQKPLTRNERYIKSKIEVHLPGQYAKSKQTKIYFSQMLYAADIDVFEITGYENETGKGVVFGTAYVSDISISGNVMVQHFSVDHATITDKEAQLILDNYQNIIDLSSKDNPALSDFMYNDFAISKDVFISTKVNSMNHTPPYFDFWIKGQCVAIPTSAMNNIAKSLTKFLKP